MSTLQMADVVTVVVPEVTPISRHVVSRKSSMESFLTFDRSRKAMAAIRVCCTALFATGVLARVISILKMDPWPIPTSLTLPDQGMLSFLIFLVRTIWSNYGAELICERQKAKLIFCPSRSLFASYSSFLHPCPEVLAFHRRPGTVFAIWATLCEGPRQ